MLSIGEKRLDLPPSSIKTGRHVLATTIIKRDDKFNQINKKNTNV